MTGPTSEIVSALQNTELFAAISSGSRNKLVKNGKVMKLQRGDVLFQEGDVANELFIILSGTIRVTSSSPNGELVELHRSEAPETLGELALLDGGMRSASATATAPSTLFVISREDFDQALEHEPELRRTFFRIMARMVRETSGAIARLMFLHVKARVASQLLTLTHGQSGDLTRSRRVTQREIAEMIGGTRQSVNQALRLFEEAGYISTDAEGIHVVDVDGLRAFAEISAE